MVTVEFSVPGGLPASEYPWKLILTPFLSAFLLSFITRPAVSNPFPVTEDTSHEHVARVMWMNTCTYL